MQQRPILPILLAVLIALSLVLTQPASAQAKLEVHRVFNSHMVLQRDQPIVIWGWADAGAKVSVKLGDESVTAEATGKDGRWSATFAPRAASGQGVALVITAGDKTVTMDDVVFGDVWVMNGQSNMAFGLKGTQSYDLESAQAHLPLLRCMKISTNESQDLQTQIPESALTPWTVATPESAGDVTAIGYNFGATLQRALQIPIGIIDTSRGGASIESLVPEHKFDDHPIAKTYKASVEAKIAAFDAQALIDANYAKEIEKLKKQNVPEKDWPAKPGIESLRSWSIPGVSPSDLGSCYNGMFGVFKGISIKGVLFHQGYNNAMNGNCRPVRYRVLMKLMVEGWREDFNQPNLPVGIIGFCAGGIPQTDANFEAHSFGGAAYIRESQRLGLADAGDEENTAFLPAYDIQIPGLHPARKSDHALRAARWALNRVYDQKIDWDLAKLVSAKAQGDVMVLTFDKPVYDHSQSMAVEGFAVAGADGKFYKAYAAHQLKKGPDIWNTPNKSCEANIIHLYSPLVKEPVAVRYGWSSSPMGNLYVNGKPWNPLHSFRTDNWDWPESDDPDVNPVSRTVGNDMSKDALDRNIYRKAEEAKQATEILQRVETLGVAQ